MENYCWYKQGIIYQIYPRSFLDTNSDGVGDLNGIIKKLDYLVELGVEGIWINPFFRSPMKDFGYDISDFLSVDSLFGNSQDLLRLVQECHKKGLKIILDMVFNHTSDQHPWFLESSSNTDNPKRDWYIWQNKIPNNWQSLFGGSAWTQSQSTGQYYYHFFLQEQPDLNLRNPYVIDEIKKILKYYLDLGVDGFRLDATNTYFEDFELQDNPNTDYCPTEYTIECQIRKYNFDHYSNLDFLAEIKTLVSSYPGDRVLIGEVAKDGVDRDAWKKYYGTTKKALDIVFNFDFLYDSFTPQKVINVIKEWENLGVGNWPSYVFSSHDQVRGVSRYWQEKDSEEVKSLKAKIMAVLLLTVRGTPFIYYGQEIGMPQFYDITKEQTQDPWAIRTNFRVESRDGCRTPMLWDSGQNAGFSKASSTWLPITKNYQNTNVEIQNTDPNSILNFYKQFIDFRKKHPALLYGDLEIVDTKSSNLVVFKRLYESEELLVVLNFTDKNEIFEYDGNKVLFSPLVIEDNKIPAFSWVILK